MDDFTSQEQDLTCPRCGAAFAYEKDFEEHVTSHVTGSPTAEHICTACGASFESLQELEDHSQVHMEQRKAA